MAYDQHGLGYAREGGANGRRQPNFLQKLYELVLIKSLNSACFDPFHSFLALEPHPCPEVMYWASDQRQLVIAQPDRVSQILHTHQVVLRCE